MKKYVLQCNSICKNYYNNKILDNVSLSIGEGDIYGFVGKNGAGKTTTIRIILGLVKADSGSIKLFENKENLNSSRKNIGSLIEKPLFYENMNAKENLQLVKIQRGLDYNINIDEVLRLVGLQNSSKKSKNFSLGMKQRLGIALALINNPNC